MPLRMEIWCLESSAHFSVLAVLVLFSIFVFIWYFVFHTSILQRTSQCQAQRADSRGTCTFRYTLSFLHCGGSGQCNSFFKQSSGNWSHILCNNSCSPRDPKWQYMGFFFWCYRPSCPFPHTEVFKRGFPGARCAWNWIYTTGIFPLQKGHSSHWPFSPYGTSSRQTANNPCYRRKTKGPPNS